MISFLEFFIYASTGLVAGFLSGLLGVGGGLVVVPILLLTFHFLDFATFNAMQVAIGTSLAAMVLTSATSAWAHRKNVEWFFFKDLVPGIILGSMLGAVIAHLLPTQYLQIIFGVFIAIFGTYFLLFAKIKETSKYTVPYIAIIHLIGLVIGAISSILGIGGGIITVPVLTFFGVSLRNAIATSAVTGFLIAIVGALSFFYLGLREISPETNGYIYLPAFISIGIVAAIAAPWGAKYAYSTSTLILRRIFGGYQLLTGIFMIYF